MTISKIFNSKTIGKQLLILSAFTLSGYLAAAADFSGEWKLNESKSTLGQFGRAAKKLKIEGKVEGMAIHRFVTNQAGEEVTTDEKYTFDDKETENTVFGTTKRKSKAKWSDDGKTLKVKSTMSFERNGETTEIKGEDTWSLSDDGKTLTIESTTTSSRGTNTTKMVYDKV